MTIPDPGPLVGYLPSDRPCFAFLRGGDGFVAFGEIARLESPTMPQADRWWSDLIEQIENETEIPGAFGAGPLAVGSFAFDDATTARPSVFVVPELIIGRRHGTSWITQIGFDSVSPVLPELQSPPVPPHSPRIEPGTISPVAWMQRVHDAVEAIRAGELKKVVLARDLLVQAGAAIDLRGVLARLVHSYGSATAFLVDGFVGATPEMLVRREGGLVISRVLAGTIPRVDDVNDQQQAARLVASRKDEVEHQLAVQSVADALAPLMTGMHVPEAPFVLTLPNVMHLATDVVGVCSPGYSTLALAAAVHPTAAACGVPTDAAREYIRTHEGLDRGGFAGPVGWMDAQGDGEWALALRCGQLTSDPRRMRLFAGSGLVADSDPHAELVETEAKFEPMRQALS